MSTTTDIKEGYKKTAVGVIPEDWEVKLFNQCFSHLKTYTYSRNQMINDVMENAIHNIHYGDIHSTFPRNHLDIKNCIELVPVIKDPYLDSPEFIENGDLIMADASEDYDGVGQSIEIINIEDKKVVAGTHTFALRPKVKLAPKYAGYIFSNSHTHKELKKIATGISVYGISKSNISKVQLPIPPLPEQKAIADCLSTWDRGIEKLSKLIAAKKEQKKGLMQGLFNGKLKVENGELIQAEGGDDFTEAWEIKKFSDCFRHLKTYTFSRNQLDYNRTENNIHNIHYGDIHTVFPKNILNVKKHIDLIPVIKDSKLVEIELLRDGDLVMADASEDYEGIGQSIELVNVGNTKIISGTHTFALRPKINFAPRFVGYIYSSFFAHKKLKRIATGISVYGISKSNLSKVEMNIPSLIEQTTIAKVLTTADKEIELLEKKLAAFKTQKKGLMQLLLTGEKRLVERG